MAEPYVYKPETRKGPIFLAPEPGSGPPQIRLADGRVITAVRADRAGGVFQGHEGYQYVFPRDVLNQEGATLIFNGKEQKLGNTNMSYRGGSLGSLQESGKGALGDTSGDLGASTGFGATGVGEFGVAPKFIGDQFPDPALIKNLKYNFIDPVKFAETYNPFLRSELAKNFAQSKDFALSAIDTELQALTSYLPKSAALKRDVTAQDNIFNQAQRTQQVMGAIPDVVGDLNSVAADARAYARGEVPNDVVDNALELGTRSAAADVAATSGFGVRSSASRKLSDLMSAKDRIGLSQYGEDLLSKNAAQRADLLLAPTEYSNAGQQISVTPSVSGSQLQTSLAGEANAQTLVSSTNAFGQTIQQSQFMTDLQNNIQQFNANNLNNFALSYFNYLNSYVNSVAGAAQTNINTNFGIQQQEDARDLAANEQHQTQGNNQIAGIIGAVGTVIGGVAGFF